VLTQTCKKVLIIKTAIKNIALAPTLGEHKHFSVDGSVNVKTREQKPLLGEKLDEAGVLQIGTASTASSTVTTRSSRSNGHVPMPLLMGKPTTKAGSTSMQHCLSLTSHLAALIHPFQSRHICRRILSLPRQVTLSRVNIAFFAVISDMDKHQSASLSAT
jgi:hypothetical protein